MHINEYAFCDSFPCIDVKHDRYRLPDIDIKPEMIRMVMISEAAPENPEEYYYAQGKPLFEQTTLQAFQQAGVEVTSIRELVEIGVYFTTAIKCGKTGYGIKTPTIKECSFILERELALFPNIRVFMLMGDVAIQSANTISQRLGYGRAIPAGSTYKIRGGKFTLLGKPAFPSYLQVGPSFGIEKSKQHMIAEDIASAMKFLK